jgi:hypothetical protein
MRTDFVNDVGAPILVTAINIVGKRSTQVMFGQSMSNLLTYAMTAGGYLANEMGWGGKYTPFLKNVAIAAAPRALELLYNNVSKTTAVFANAGVSHRVSRYPAPAAESPFQGVRLV